MSGTVCELKRTPLYCRHLAAGARMVPFSGWDMPVQYSGIIEEHMHTRSKAGLFDICHMGEFFLRGARAAEELDRLVTCRVDDLPEGRCRYGFLLNDEGGIIDDLIVFRIREDEFELVVNAGTVEKDKRWILGRISSGDMFSDRSANIAKLDIQGPLSPGIMGKICGDKAVMSLKRFSFTYMDINGVTTMVSRTGYTGEEGYELFFPAEESEKFWDMFLAFDEVKPVGLGARDTLRMEMGYSLYGNDIDEKHTPLEANLARFVFMGKDFTGKEALVRRAKEGVKRVLTGFICEGRRSARPHFTVYGGGKAIGEVTSGGFSPCLKKGIGLCYLEKDFNAEGREITLSDGKTEIKAAVKQVPIYKR
ncbi:MAG: glycine cleavage system aminomethyltransferase GcvT [Candidatus Omnitrophota bacterium]